MNHEEQSKEQIMKDLINHTSEVLLMRFDEKEQNDFINALTNQVLNKRNSDIAELEKRLEYLKSTTPFLQKAINKG